MWKFIQSGRGEEQVAGNISGFVTTHGFNLHLPSYVIGGEHHRPQNMCLGFVGRTRRSLPGARQQPFLGAGGSPGRGHRRQYFTPTSDLGKVFLNEYFLGSQASQASGEGKRKCHESSLTVSKQLCLFSLFSRRDYWKLFHSSLSSNLYSCPINKALCKGTTGHSYL